ncbi:MAG TPA: penicillin-binding transpeptidase domain-containing protein [Longimicrobiaceae bacterium]|nr:penicillin-binding transpeptidase domain-containing protein [Longimicrobiaceae bacterium]
MLDTVLNWVLRGVVLALAAGASVALLRLARRIWGERRERWAVRIALGMILLAGVYTAGHARLLLQREKLEEGRMMYSRFGDPRLTELRRAEVRGWILDCSGRDADALARYGVRNGEVDRIYPLGEAGANLVGGGRDTVPRDYTVERLFSEQLREPVSLAEAGQLHPAGTDLRLTLCAAPTRAAWELLRATGRPGTVIVQEVRTGAVVAYAATGNAQDPPLGIKQYAPPGSVFKLALAALWWEGGLGDPLIPCPSTIQITPRASISNFEMRARGVVEGPTGVLIPSCNTGAVWMAQQARQRLGEQAFVEAYRRFGFEPYTRGSPPTDTVRDFWSTSSDAWARRMSPPVSRIRIHERTGVAEWAQLSIGQGPVDVTPIAVSRFVQAIGNGGVMLPPTLEWERAQDVPEGRRVMSAETSRKLQVAMLRVVDEGTAASAAPLLEGTGWEMGGKTGTAQLPGKPDDGWFAGLIYGPDRRPRYTVVVYLRGGGPGGRAPAAVAAGMTRVLARMSAAAAGGRG